MRVEQAWAWLFAWDSGDGNRRRRLYGREYGVMQTRRKLESKRQTPSQWVLMQCATAAAGGRVQSGYEAAI